MFHPLLPDMSGVKDLDLENKISELSKKYSIAARMGYSDLCGQLLLALQQYRDEQQRRIYVKTTVKINDEERDLGNLINVNR